MTTLTQQQLAEIAEIKAQIKAINDEAKRRTKISVHNSCSSYDWGEAYMYEQQEKFSELVQKLFWAEWTKEIFEARRQEWNTEIQKLMTPKGVKATEVRKLEQKLGYKLDDIKKAKARYA